jgi:hypothetical protein
VTRSSCSTSSLLHHLARHPEHRQLLRDEPGLWDRATEEFLRLDAPTISLSRTVTVDGEIGRCPVARGSHLGICYAAANRDPAEFDEPDTWDPAARRTATSLSARDRTAAWAPALLVEEHRAGELLHGGGRVVVVVGRELLRQPRRDLEEVRRALDGSRRR